MTPLGVLVVDDEADVGDLFQRRFRREIRRGEVVLTFAASGEDALRRLAAHAPPEVMLILSDINMPGMSGFELLGHVRDRWPELPVAMITAYGDEDRHSRAEALGAADFLTKPLHFEALKARITELAAPSGGAEES